jgi:hypothetical protein
MPSDDAFVSAVLAESVELNHAKRTATLHGVGMPIVELPVGADQVRYTATLYYTLYMRNPRPGAHQVRVVVRHDDAREPLVLDSFVLEKVIGELEARTTLVDVGMTSGRYFVCVEVDGQDRAVLPLVVGRLSRRG